MAKLRSQRDLAVEEAYQARKALVSFQKQILDPRYQHEDFLIEREQLLATIEEMKATILNLRA